MSEKDKNKNPSNKDSLDFQNPLPGIYRKTLRYNKDLMLCFFKLEEGSQIPLHEHESQQMGYVLKGKIEFITENDENNFIAVPGDSYIFKSYERHGAMILKTAKVIEVFSPAREEYKL
ncbi:MAG: cupin domain-containing protein [Promethearchaeia archaeon]